MKTLEKNMSNEIIINKSRFICEIIKINDLNEVDDVINNIKLKYKDATHYCYAYIVSNYKKCSDDGEPSGTAGMPILNVLEQKDLSNIICIVIRYFGGIKLGAGGLVRAYTKSVTSLLDLSNIVDLKKGKIIKIVFDYDNIKNIDYILKDINIINKIYDNEIFCEFIISNDDYDNIINSLHNFILNYEIIKEIYI